MTGSAAATARAEPGADKRDMKGIIALCRAYSDARAALQDVYDEIAAERQQAIRRRRRALEARAAEVSAAKEALKAAIGTAPELFTKPRTRAIEGIKVGFRKLPGRFEMADEARTIKRIRERMPDREGALIKVKESVDKPALKHLDTRELASIGVTLVLTDDEIVIAAPKTDHLDKLVEALMVEAEGEA